MLGANLLSELEAEMSDEDDRARALSDEEESASEASGSLLGDGAGTDDGPSASSADEDSDGQTEEEENDDKYTSFADLEAEVARLEDKLAERDKMMQECVAEGWDTSALEREMSSLQEALEKYRVKVAARAEQAAIERAERETRALQEAKGRELDKADAALLRAVKDPDRDKRRAAIAAAEKAGTCRSEAVEEAKRIDEHLAADVASKKAEAAKQEAKIMAWINAKSEDAERRWGFEEQDEKWVQPQSETGEKLRERREYSLSTAAPLVTDLFHALIRRMPDNPVAFCRHYMTMVRDANSQLGDFERNPAEYRAREQRQAAAEKGKPAGVKSSQDFDCETEHHNDTKSESGSEEHEEQAELADVARGSPFFEDRVPTQTNESQANSVHEEDTYTGRSESTDLDVDKQETSDDDKNAGALFGDLYGAGLLGGPLQKNKPHAYATGVTSYATHRRKARGGSYFDDLARSKVLDYAWGQHARGRKAYLNDHAELFSITRARSTVASRESRRTVSRGLQSSRGSTHLRQETATTITETQQVVELPPIQ